MLVIGEIIKAQGILGEIKVKPLTNNPERFKKLRAAYIDTALYQIAGIRLYDGFVFIRFVGVDNRDKAESLVGKFIGIERIHAIPTDDDEFFITDLLACDFYIDGQKEGRLQQVYQNGSADVFEVLLNDGRVILFPFLLKLELQIDLKNGTISVKSDDLWSVAVIN